MNTISILAANSASSIAFVLQLAKLNQVLGRETAFIPKNIFSEFLYQYPYDLMDIADIDLFDNKNDANPNCYCFQQGYEKNANAYLIILEHNLFNIRYVSQLIENLELENVVVILLDALDITANIDYICGIYFKKLNIPISDRLTISLDEIDNENIFLNQIDGKVELKQLSNERRNALLKLASRILNVEDAEIKQAQKILKKRGLL